MDDVCPKCSRPLAGDGLHGCAARGFCGAHDVDCLDCRIECLEAQVAKAWDEGYRVGVDCGSGIGFARDGFTTDNPHRKAS